MVDCDVRSFFRADSGSAASFADGLVGSPQIFGHEARKPEQSVNFVTCHDGLALNGLVSYDRKRNEANGEYDRDGAGRARGNRSLIFELTAPARGGDAR